MRSGLKRSRGVCTIRPEIVAGERDVVPPDRGDVRQLLVRERDTLATSVGDGAGQVGGVPETMALTTRFSPEARWAMSSAVRCRSSPKRWKNTARSAGWQCSGRSGLLVNRNTEARSLLQGSLSLSYSLRDLPLVSSNPLRSIPASAVPWLKAGLTGYAVITR